MIHRVMRAAAVLLLPLALASCVLAPGKFTSTLKIDADGHFAFAYQGEVIDAGDSADIPNLGADKPSPAEARANAEKAAQAKAETERKRRALAEALSHEAGYRQVTYLGDGKFMVDYAITGTLTHDFVWPFNLDAEVMFPFIALELRKGGTVRVKAPAFANDDSSGKAMGDVGGLGGMGSAASGASQLDGSFTLDTDAAIVSQNNEDGVSEAGGRKIIRWRATPQTKVAPTAVLRLATGG
ncbi:hypothetical protein ACLB0R_08310 [Sphingomonas sp. GlSt437]